MGELVDELFETLGFKLQREFSRYIVRISRVKESFYALIKKPRRKILGEFKIII